MYDFQKASGDGRTARMYVRMSGGKTTKSGRKISGQVIVLAVIFLLMIILNVVSWNSTAFSDWYARTVFHFIGNVFSHISSVFSFSVGEVLIYLGIGIVTIGLLLLIISLIFVSKNRGRILAFAGKFIAWVLAFICVTETMNCFIMYHCTTIEEQKYSDRQYTVEELTAMVEYYIDNLNSLSSEVERSSDGTVYLGSDDEMIAGCITAMNEISDDYTQLSGYYPRAKKISSSMLMTQLGYKGIYFPFTLEANYNGAMTSANYPSTICHEYAHVKGYIFEDEANYISFVATTESGSNEIAYSGYLTAFNYSYNELANYIDDEKKVEILSKVDTQVWSDNIFVTEEYRSKIEKEAKLPTETVSEAGKNFTETNLKANGVFDGSMSYNRVVELLLRYYYSKEPAEVTAE